jgi:hypothetical protein
MVGFAGNGILAYPPIAALQKEISQVGLANFAIAPGSADS